MSMQKKLKYLFTACLFISLILISSNSVSAQVNFQGLGGSTCGASGEGKCKPACDAYDEILSSTATLGGNTCTQSEQCCLSTKCSNNNLGFSGTGVGGCVNGVSCEGTLGHSGYIGLNTSDCLPPKLCCVLPKGAQVPGSSAPTENTINPTSEDNTNIFTGESQTQAGQAEVPEGKTGGLVPCNGFDCSLCDIFILLKNLINFFTGFVFALAGGFVVWGGIEIMIAGGNETKVSSGRERITTAVIGIVIALGAWLFIGTLLQVLTDSPSALPWNKIQCSSKTLQSSIIKTGNDNACTSKNGNCKDISISPCPDGTSPVKNLCLSPQWKSNSNAQCCVPNK